MRLTQGSVYVGHIPDPECDGVPVQRLRLKWELLCVRLYELQPLLARLWSKTEILKLGRALRTASANFGQGPA